MWLKSRRCNGASACVEVRPPSEETGGMWQMRDSKNPDGPTLSFDDAEWQTFTAGVRDGEFDPDVLARPSDGPPRAAVAPVADSGADPVPA